MPIAPSPHPERRSLVYLAMLSVGLVGYYLSTDYAVQAVLISAATLAAPAAVAIGIRVHRPDVARPWWLLALGLAVMATGSAIDWIAPIFGVTLGVPSIADVFYLPGYLLMLGALWLISGGRVRGAGVGRAGVEASIIAVAVGMLVWTFIVDPVVDASVLPPLGLLVTIAYPIIDVLMLGIAVHLVLLPGTRPRVVQYLVIALVSVFASDMAWTYLATTGGYESATIVDLGWWLAPMFWGAAGLHPSMTGLGAPRLSSVALVSTRRLVALAGASIVAPVVIIIESMLGVVVDEAEIAVGAIALSLLVVARLAVAVRELTDSLERRSALQGQLSHQARHDPLTGLANRLEFTERLQAELRRVDSIPAVLLLDLDDFKAVNDSQGHEVGDLLLVAVADRLHGNLRDLDLACRLGGDEFAILVDGATEAVATDIATRLLLALDEPFDVDGHLLFARASIGIALADATIDDAADLLRNADIAMYLAKSQGKRRAELYYASMHSSIIERIALRSDLEHAIDDHEFVIEYQPIYGIGDGRLQGFEALVRWQHPTRGFLPPSEFIDLAEETGLIVPLGALVMTEACRQMGVWRATQPEATELDLAVNVSAIQLRHPGFLDQLRHVLEATGVPPASLVIELTESVLSDTDVAVRALEDLKAIGVRLAIDDFGTGYSSLSYLGRFPIDILKIDRSFINALGTGSKEATLTETILSLAGNLRLQTVAEGIEDDRQLDTLRALGCDLGQGYLLARPLPVWKATDLIGGSAATGAMSDRATTVPPGPAAGRRARVTGRDERVVYAASITT